jgi:APA family basic amino acid/polyamine antiporter
VAGIMQSGNPAASPGLSRGLGVTAGISINVANIIGTGVFLKSRVMTCNVEDPLAVLGVWLGAGLLVLVGALCYAEVSAMMPEAGGEYVYLRRAYGRATSFLFGWTQFVIVKAASQAALAIACAIFLNVAAGGWLDQWHFHYRAALAGFTLDLSALQLVALVILWTTAWINCASVRTSGGAASVLTALKVAIVVAVGIGALLLAPGSWTHLSMSGAGGDCEGVEDSARGGLAGVGAAMLGALWAYDGWNNVAPLAGEVRQPQRNLPRIFATSAAAVIVLYVFVNAAYFYVLTPQRVASIPATGSLAVEVLRLFLGPMAVTFAALALMVSSFGALHASVLAGARIPYAMARDGLFFRGLARVSPHTHVPIRAVVVQSIWASALALSGSYDTLTDAVIFAAWLFYGLAAASLLVFRRSMPEAPRPYRAFGYPLLPAIFVLASAGLLFTSFLATPRQAIYGVALMLAGLPFYLHWNRASGRKSPEA